MANKKIIAQKAGIVEEIRAKFAGAQSVVLVDYRGLSVGEVTQLRNDFRAAGVEYVVLKNSMVERAAAMLGYDELIPYLAGPSAFAFGVNDVVAPAKILRDFIKKVKKAEIKCGIINGKVENAAAMTALADLPSREVLIARILGSINAPVTGLAIALNKIKEQKEAAEA